MASINRLVIVQNFSNLSEMKPTWGLEPQEIASFSLGEKDLGQGNPCTYCERFVTVELILYNLLGNV
jgi:hypothetical protein